MFCTCATFSFNLGEDVIFQISRFLHSNMTYYDPHLTPALEYFWKKSTPLSIITQIFDHKKMTLKA